MGIPFNSPGDTIPAIVVDINDPEERGRVKVQTLEQSEIQPENLKWMFFHSDRHPQIFSKDGAVGETPHAGMLVGSWINVPRSTDDQQTIKSEGTIPTDGTSGGQG